MEILEAFKLCPRCGSSIEKKANYIICKNCGLQYYDNPRPCSAILLQNSKNEYLLVKRAIDPGKGLWDLPGGFVEKEETFEQGAIRELQEELGITLSGLKYFGSDWDKYLYEGLEYHTVIVIFYSRIGNLELKPADDVADFAFFKLDDLPVDIFAFPAMRRVFDALLSKS